MNGCDETVHHEPLPLSLDRPIAIGRPDGAWIVCVIKRIKRRPLDRDPTVQMSSARFNQDRYNPSLNRTCLWSRSVVRAPRDRRVWCRHVAEDLTIITRLKKARAWLIDRWSASTRSTRGFPMRRRSNASHRSMWPALKHFVGLYSHTEKISGIRRVYNARQIKGSNTLRDYGRLTIPIIYMYYIA